MSRLFFAVVSVTVVVLGGVQAVLAAPADDQYFAAATHYSQARWSQAREAFQTFLAAHPNHPQSDQARFYLGESLVQLREYATAADHFQTLFTRRLGDALYRKVLYRAGESAYFAKRFDQAQQQLTRFVNEFPADKLNAYVLPYLGDIAFENADLAKANQFYSEGLERFPQGALSGECRLGQAKICERQQKTVEAHKIYDEAIARADNWSDDAQLRKAQLHARFQQHDAAIQVFQKLLSDHPTSSLVDQTRLGLGQAMHALQRDTEAEQYLTAMPTDSALEAEARYWLGMVQLRLKKQLAAAQSFEAVLTANPEHPQSAELANLIGEQLLAVGQVDSAKQWFERAIAKNPSGEPAAKSLLKLIEIAEQSEDLTAMLAHSEHFLRQFNDHPQSGTPRLHVARERLATHQPTEAIKLLEPLLNVAERSADKLTPSDREMLVGRYLLALAYQAENRAEDALRLLPTLTASSNKELAETRQQAWRLQAALLVSQAKFAPAAEALRQYLTQPVQDGESAARAQLAICYTRLKDVEQAKQAFAEFVASKPSAELLKATSQALAESVALFEDETTSAELLSALAQLGATIDPILTVYQTARAAEKQGKFETAANAYQKLMDTPPPGVSADLLWYNAAWAWKQAGKADQARAAFETLRRDYVDSKLWNDATYRLAELCLEANQAEQASQLLAALMQRQPQGDVLVHALYLQSQLAVKAERWRDVASPLQKIVEQYPQHALRPLAEFWLAESDYRQRNFDLALQRLNLLAASLDKETRPAWVPLVMLRRAQILVQQKQYTEAREIAAQVVREYPQFEQLYEVDYVWGRTLAMAAEFDEARAAYQRVIQSPRGARTETAAMAQWMLAETYFHQRQFEAAAREYLRVETVYTYPSWQALALLQAGKCYEQLSQWSQAGDVYTRLIKNHPQSSPAEEASKRLQATREQLTRK